MTRSHPRPVDPGPGTPTDPSARPSTVRPLLLVVGHLVVAAGALVLAVLMLGAGLAEPTPDELPGVRLTGPLPLVMLVAGLGALAVGQILSIRHLLDDVVPARRRGLDEAALRTGARRIGLPASIAVYPYLLGVTSLATNPPPTVLFALLCALCSASLLLDGSHAGWIHRHIDGRGPRTRTLTTGDGARVRTGQRTMAILFAVIAAAAALLLIGAAVRPLSALLKMIWMETKLFLREPAMLAFSVLLPIGLMLVFGLGFRGDPAPVGDGR